MLDGKKIIIAEDSNIILSVVSRILQNMNYEVLGVRNGVELLKILEKQKCDLILMDINMPKMDGITCAREIRKHSKDTIKNIPIIALSGNAKNLSVEEFKEEGINDLIQKPIDFDLMARKIQEYLN